MRKIKFTKMVASGNDFVLIDRLLRVGCRLSELAKKICDRKFGIGADGLLLLEKSRKADVKMRIFNADGSEAEMCGNGARCVALWASTSHQSPVTSLDIETKAGIIKAEVKKDNVKIKLTDPKNIKLDIPLSMGARILRVNFVDTGVPHCVIFVDGIDKINVVGLGREIRHHEQFAPRGTNVNFVELMDRDSIKIRTYERGVEDETLACGTGSMASAVISGVKMDKTGNIKIDVLTKSKEILKVYFKRIDKVVNDTWLEGKARIVYKGEYDV